MSDPLSNSPAIPATVGSHARSTYEPFTVELKNGAFAVACEEMPTPSTWQIEQDCHTLIVHLHGRMHRLETHIDGGGTYRGAVRPGDIWLIPAQRRYRGRVTDATIAYAELKLDRRALSVLNSGRDIPLRPRMRHRDPLLQSLVERLATLSVRQDDLSCMLRESVTTTLALHLLHEHTHTIALTDSVAAGLEVVTRRRLEDYILTHLDQRLSLPELAKLAALGEHQFIPAFRRSFGATPMQYIIARRLELARSLLASTRQDITSIALLAGFSSHSHLSATFRQHYGVTPRHYRAQAKGY